MSAGTLIRIARILRSHGLKGELRVSPFNGHVGEIAQGTEVVLENRYGKRQTDRLVKWRDSGLMEIENLNDRESAELWAGGHVLIDKRNLAPLPHGEYYIDDVIGVEVFDAAGIRLGTITDIFSAGASDLYEITVDGRKHLIPARGDIVKSLDPERHRMVIDPIPGLLE